jgi:phosphatidylserine/phosphatidylglycerophosphate/cardiolipin synthase-like enzyme
MARSLMDILDSVVGDGIERLNQAHHRRRMLGIGQLDAMDPPGKGGWARVACHPPRDGNTLEVFIDGAEAFPRMADEMRSATSHVHIAGWNLDPDFEIERDPGTTIGALLAEIAERVVVRVLLWAGPPLPAFRPHRSDVRKVRDTLTAGGRVKCVLDSREFTMHCHHEKLVIVDDRVAFVGGLDLTTLEGDRFDSSEHPRREGIGWHDGATRLTGPVVTDVAEHFRQRWQEIAREELAEPEPQPATGALTVQMARTVPEKTYRFLPRGEFSILESYLRALRSAERLIYLENQFLWSTEIANILDEKLRNPPSDEFRVLLVLPVKPNNGKESTRGQLGGMIQSDVHDRLLATTIRSGTGPGSGVCYVHAKIGIVDDRWFTLGSGNLNEHSLFNDTEVNVVCHDPDLARDTRLRLWSEHLGMPVEQIAGTPDEVIDRIWAPIAKEQLRRQDAGEAATHRLLALPRLSRRTDRLEGPIRGLLVDG